MLNKQTPPQPRFRIWDRVFYKGSGFPIEQTVIGINWDDYHNDYEIAFAPLPQNVDSQFAMDSDPNLRLVSRPGLEPLSPAETPRQKADRLKQEFERCDDKGWLGKMVEWEKAEAAIEEADPQAQSEPNEMARLTRLLESLVERVIALDRRLGAMEIQIRPFGPMANLFDQWVKPVVIGTACASDNKDG